VEHVVANFKSAFEGVEYVTTFKALVLRNEQNLESRGGVGSGDGSGGSGRAGGSKGVAEWRKARDAQEEDEAYFDGDDDASPIGPSPRNAADQHSPGTEGGAGSGFGGGGGAPPSAASARGEAYERSNSGAISDGSTTGMCSSGSEAGSDSESEGGSLSGAESPPPPTSPNAAVAFKPVLKLSSAGPTRPVSPPMNSPPKDGLGRMFEMGHRIPTPVAQRAHAAMGAINVRKIEMVLPVGGSALGGNAFVGGASGGSDASDSVSGSASESALPALDGAAAVATGEAGGGGDPDAKRQKV
jgi:hypothetical protein